MVSIQHLPARRYGITPKSIDTTMAFRLILQDYSPR